ncbi:hypothetical protein AALP_AA2G072500 [Arabis alpina]|uniref:Uncharacterized protein n=1 Tax=Arabis alpina TaxID=50452 RepID=A0A087HFU9_ARAAL|nr:hypothetical protein AALP_AA2G072500 [Arabis alpina]
MTNDADDPRSSTGSDGDPTSWLVPGKVLRLVEETTTSLDPMSTQVTKDPTSSIHTDVDHVPTSLGLEIPSVTEDPRTHADDGAKSSSDADGLEEFHKAAEDPTSFYGLVPEDPRVRERVVDDLSFLNDEDSELPPGRADASSSCFSFDSRASSVESDDEDLLVEVEQKKKAKKKAKKKGRVKVRPNPPRSTL